MTVAEAAAKWGVSPRRVRQWIVEGRLRARMVGGVYILPRNADRPAPKTTRRKRGGK